VFGRMRKSRFEKVPASPSTMRRLRNSPGCNQKDAVWKLEKTLLGHETVTEQLKLRL
jgi:hypothetical protein